MKKVEILLGKDSCDWNNDSRNVRLLESIVTYLENNDGTFMLTFEKVEKIEDMQLGEE